MPIYEYKCKKCDENFELFVRVSSQQDKPACPECGSSKVKKAISLFGLSGANASSRTVASCGPAPT